MPYIRQEQRNALQVSGSPRNAGELNFCLTVMVDAYLARLGKNYENLNAAIGVLECAKLELYRRIAAPYEDKKIQENGDVYGSAECRSP